MFQTALRPPTASAPVCLAVLVLLGDWLFWDGGGGLSVVLFVLAVAVGAYLLHPSRPEARAEGDAALVLVLGLLPLLERLQPLSVAFALLGLALAVLRLQADRPIIDLLRGSLRLLAGLPIWSVTDAIINTTELGQRVAGYRPNVRAYLLPLGFGVAFCLLIVSANPVIEAGLGRVLRFETDFEIARLVFWVILAVLVWPFLALSDRVRLLLRPARSVPAYRLLSAASLAHSLIAFNLIFAVQTSMDLRYLLSSRVLPDGMSYAEYAHRGAYPLVGLALLAGIFMLIAMPFVKERGDLKPLLGLWLAQTLALTLGSAFRLTLYVESYGMTYLRLRAAIWMGLILIGLVILALQLWQDRTRVWAMLRIGSVAVGVLYACAFVNFASIIAAWNIAARDEVALDIGYLAELGADAAVPVQRYRQEVGHVVLPYPVPRPPEIDGWREWGFRSARIQRKFAAMTAEALR